MKKGPYELHRQLIAESQALQHRLADAGLWRTFHAMAEVLQCIGWESAEHIGRWEKAQRER